MNTSERISFARRVAALGLLTASMTMLGAGVSAGHRPAFSEPIAPAPHAAKSVRPRPSLDPSGALLQFGPANLAPLAGGGSRYNEGGVGSAVNAGNASDIKVDASGNILYVDIRYGTLRRISATDGTVTTIAGVPAAETLLRVQSLAISQPQNSAVANAKPVSRRELTKARLAALASLSHGGLHAMARGQALSTSSIHFDDPVALAIDASGNIFIADDFAQVVYEIVGDNVTVIAGQPYEANYSGDGGPATAAELNSPEALAFDKAGNLLIADAGNDIVRRIDKITGNISTIAGLPLQTNSSGDGGPATAAGLVFPDGLAVDAAGDIYISDGDANVIRRIDTTGNISTLAGTGNADYYGDGGSATAAAISSPGNLAVDAAGSLYIADYENNVIRKVDSAGIIHTVAGSPYAPTYNGQTAALSTAFNLGNLNAVAVESNGAMDIGAGAINYVVRVGASTSLDFGTLGFNSSVSQNLTLSNAGSAPLQFSGPPVVSGADYSVRPSATNGCDFSSALTLAPGAQCGLSITLTNEVYGVDAGSITFTDNAAGSTQVVALTALTPKVGTTTQLTVISTAASAGSSLTLYAKVKGADDGRPTGSVNFYDDQPTGPVLVGSGALDASASTSTNTPALTAGAHNFYAVYPGVAQYDASQSAPQTVSALGTGISSIVLTATPGTVSAGATIDASVTVTGNSTTPTGTVLFRMAGTTVGAATLANGVATLDFAAIGTSNTAVVASYLGDTTYNPATSNLVPIGIAAGPIVQFVPESINNFAGGGETYNEGGQATNARVETPTGVAVDSHGNVYFGDSNYATVRRVNASNGTIVTIAGQIPGNTCCTENKPSSKSRPLALHGKVAVTPALPAGYSTRPRAAIAPNTPGAGYEISNPQGVASDAKGDVYFADNYDAVVYKIDTSGYITVAAGTAYNSGFSGDGAAATLAKLSGPTQIALDAAGNLYIADTYNSVIRKVDTITGIITTIAGTPNTFDYTGDGGPAASATLNQPYGIALNSAGEIFIADSGNNAIRKIDANGIIRTVAGDGNYNDSGDGGPASAAELANPTQLGIDAAGSLYIADNGNDVIRKIDANGIIRTAAGNKSGLPNLSGALSEDLGQPNAVALDAAGDLFITSNDNGMVFSVTPTSTIDFGDNPLPYTAAQTLTIANAGTSALHFSGDPSLNAAGFTIAPAAAHGCDFSQPLAPGTSCDEVVTFSPPPPATTPGRFSSTTMPHPPRRP